MLLNNILEESLHLKIHLQILIIMSVLLDGEMMLQMVIIGLEEILGENFGENGVISELLWEPIV